MDLDVAGDVGALAALTTRLSEDKMTKEERDFFDALKLSGAVFPTARQPTPGSAAHVGNEVEFWLEAGEVLAGPLGERLVSLRELYHFLPELRGDPFLNSLSQRDLWDAKERLSGGFCAGCTVHLVRRMLGLRCLRVFLSAQVVGSQSENQLRGPSLLAAKLETGGEAGTGLRAGREAVTWLGAGREAASGLGTGREAASGLGTGREAATGRGVVEQGTVWKACPCQPRRPATAPCQLPDGT